MNYIKVFIYIIPVIALIALVWTYRILLWNFLTQKATLKTENIHGRNHPDVQSYLADRDANHEEGRPENVYSEFAKDISKSDSYKKKQKLVFEMD